MDIKFRMYLDKNLLFLFFIPLFFLLHGINENFGLVPVHSIWKLAGFYFLITTAIIVTSLLIVGKPIKAAEFSFYLLSVFFLFGPLHDFLKSTVRNKFFISYTFLVLLIVFSTVIFLISLIRSKKDTAPAFRYFNYLVIIFVTLEIGTLIYYVITRKFLDNNLVPKNERVSFKSCSNTTKPDIFFVVFDGYTSSKCLKEEFGYENEEVDSLLNANHFFTSANSISNYNITPFSLASTMNLNYLREGLESKVASSRVFLQAMETLRDNQLVKFLRTQGYEIKNYGCFDLAGVPTETVAYFNNLAYSQIDNQTLLSRIKRDIGWNFAIKNVFTGAFS